MVPQPGTAFAYARRVKPAPVLVIALIAGCGGGDDPTDPTPLIALDEGTEADRPVETNVTAWPDAPWATVDAGTLTLKPSCSVVPGTSGAPRLFTLDGADGDRAIVVQVNPTIAGTCLPRVLACVRAIDAECDPYQDQTTGVPAERQLRTSFCSGMSCTPADEMLDLLLDNPDTTDTELVARITTDAPIAFESNPLLFQGTLLGDLYDANIAGNFLVSYEIARGASDQARLAVGSYRLQWDGGNAGLGIEGAYCTSATPQGCAVRHDPTRGLDGSQCMVAQAGPVDVGVRVWVSEMFQPPPASAIQIEAKLMPGSVPVTLHTDGQAGPRLVVSPDHPGPVDVFVEASAATGTQLELGVRPCATTGTGTPEVPHCDRQADLGPVYPATADIAIRSDDTLCPP